MVSTTMGLNAKSLGAMEGVCDDDIVRIMKGLGGFSIAIVFLPSNRNKTLTKQALTKFD